MRITTRARRTATTALLATTALTTAACGGSTSTVEGPDAAAGSGPGCVSPSGAEGPGVGAEKVGFIYVGSRDDYGYNEAAHDGAMALQEACPNLEILEADTIPETSEMATAAEQMIAQGATIIFSTSYGYKDFAVQLAAKYPDVVFLQKGNYVEGEMPENLNTYFGNVYETVYLAGIAAGQATESDKLGFVAAFPVPQTLLNINAFQMGAASVNPEVTTYPVFTGAWCDPAKQADATTSLLSEGIDVVSQHQDCSGTIIKTTEAAGAYSVGYHYNAQELAPEGWLTGSEWEWGPMYVEMVDAVLAGEFSGSEYNSNWRVGYDSETSPVPLKLSPFGPAVSTETQAQIDAAHAEILDGWSPFTGPVHDQSGALVLPEGQEATAEELDGMDYLVEGVVGSLPSGQ